MGDYDRYDFGMSLLMGGLMAGCLVLDTALWVPVVVGMGTCAVSLWRHFDLDELAPRRGPLSWVFRRNRIGSIRNKGRREQIEALIERTSKDQGLSPEVSATLRDDAWGRRIEP
jgi:hypothetical protein